MPAKFLITQGSVKKNLKRLPIQIHKKIIKALDKIKENPIIGGKLHGELENYYKFRVGDYRIVYEFDAKTSIVTVVKVEHRQGVYK